MFLVLSLSGGWILLFIFYYFFEGSKNEDTLAISSTIISIILFILFIHYKDEKHYKEILESSKKYNGVSLIDFVTLVYSGYFNKNERFKRFIPKLHIVYKLLVESEGFDMNDYSTYDPDGKFFKKINEKPYFKCGENNDSDHVEKEEFDRIIKSGSFTTNTHFVRDLHFILSYFNEDENKIKTFFSNENNKKMVLSSKHCKLFLHEKILSTKKETDKKWLEFLIKSIEMEEHFEIKKIYHELGYK